MTPNTPAMRAAEKIIKAGLAPNSHYLIGPNWPAMSAIIATEYAPVLKEAMEAMEAAGEAIELRYGGHGHGYESHDRIALDALRAAKAKLEDVK